MKFRAKKYKNTSSVSMAEALHDSPLFAAAFRAFFSFYCVFLELTDPYQEALGASRHDGRSERQEGLPSHPPERTNGADCHSAHSGTTQQGAQQPADTENLHCF